jgi:phage shock protein C
MICSHCKTEIADTSNFCNFCGARQRQTASRRRLMRSVVNSKLGGVCGGIAEYFDVDPTIVRVIWVALSVVPGGLVGGILVYILAWMIIPKAPLAAGATSGAPLETF